MQIILQGNSSLDLNTTLEHTQRSFSLSSPLLLVCQRKRAERDSEENLFLGRLESVLEKFFRKTDLVRELMDLGKGKKGDFGQFH